MANRFDTPLKISSRITPLSLPTETLSQGLVEKQQRFDNIITASDEFGNQILEAQGRAGIDDEHEFLKGLYDEFLNKRNEFVSGLDGNFSSTNIQKIKDEAQDILLPNRPKIQAILHNKKMLEVRQQQLDQLKAQGKALDFDNSLESKSTLNPDGTYNVFRDTGVEERGDWLGATHRLFKHVTSDELMERIYQDSGKTDSMDRFTFFKSVLRKVISNQGIQRHDGSFFSPDKIQAVINNITDDFIDTDKDGNQMYRWFKNYYQKELQSTNPNISPEELEKQAHQQAFERVKRTITDVGNSYKTKAEQLEELLDVRNNPRPPGQSGRRTSGSGDDIPEITPQVGTGVLSYVPGSKYNTYGAYQAEIESIEKPFNPNLHDYSLPYSSIGSIDEAYGRLVQIGPMDSTESDIPGGQFEGFSTERRGELQVLDEHNPAYRGVNNRAVYSISNQEDLDSYLEANSDSLTAEQKQKAREAFEATGEYRVPTMTVTENEDGTSDITVNPYFIGDPEIEQKVEQFKQDHSAQIATKLSHADTLRRKRILLRERERQAMLNAGYTSREEFEADVKENPAIKQEMKNIDYKYYNTIMSEIFFPISGTNTANRSSIQGLAEDIGHDHALAVGRLFENAADSNSPMDYFKAIAGDNTSEFTREFWKKYLQSQGLADKEVDSPFGNTISEVLASQYGSVDLDGLRYRMLSGVTNFFGNNTSYKEALSEIQKEKEKDISKYSPRLRRFYNNIEEMEKDYYVNSLIINIPRETQEQKMFYNGLNQIALTAVKQPNNKLYRILPDGAEEGEYDTEKAFTLREALAAERQALIAQGAISEDDDTSFNDLMSNLDKYAEVSDIRFDPVDGIVVDMAIGSGVYEVRGIKAIRPHLVGMGWPEEKLAYMEQMSSTMRENDMVHGYLGNHDHDITEFFVSQFNDESVDMIDGGSGIKKGQLYIYTENGKRLGFSNNDQLIEWHRRNKDFKYDEFVKAATPLGLPKREFELRYPGVDREAYEARFLKMHQEELNNALGAYQVISELGYERNEVDLRQDIAPNNIALPYLKPLRIDDENLASQFSQEDLHTGPEGHLEVRTRGYNSEELENNGFFSKGQRPVHTIPSMMNAMEDLRDSYGFNNRLVITQSLRDLTEHHMLYSSSEESDRIRYSPHMHGLSLDIRVNDDGGKAFVEFLETESGQDWLRKNKVRALVHKIHGNEWHLDLRYNVDVPGYARKSNYLYMNQLTGTTVNR